MASSPETAPSLPSNSSSPLPPSPPSNTVLPSPPAPPSHTVLPSTPPPDLSLSESPQSTPLPIPPQITESNDNSSSGSRLSPPRSSSSHSPPPPHKSKGHSSSSSKNSSSSDADTNVQIIAGVAVALGVLVILMVIVCMRRKKKKRQDFYTNSSRGGYNNSHPGWQNNPQGPNQMFNQPPGGGWGSPAPPTSLSGEHSSNFSGGPPRPILPPPSPVLSLGFNKNTFTYEELAAATGGFGQINLIGQGGFGYVHKGVLPNGKEVAVKSLKSGSGQGDREFSAEVDIISRVHHRHLVSLVGYCVAGDQRMLVYEFVPNNNLEHHLYEKVPVMDVTTRLQIALGSAKGLAYLHEDCHPKIIHRDIKAANILIDENFEAKVADFGLAKLSSDNFTHVSTRVMGTFGYLAPEYASSGKLTDKSDVFSFGIMLLELVTGRRPVDCINTMEDSLVDWARPLLSRALEDGNFDEIVDPRLEGKYNTQEMTKLIACAAASIRYSARKRPKMSQIVRALEGDASLDDLYEGAKPGQSSVFGSSGGSSEYSQSSYQADMKKFRQIALSTTEFPSVEFEGSNDDSNEMAPKKP